MAGVTAARHGVAGHIPACHGSPPPSGLCLLRHCRRELPGRRCGRRDAGALLSGRGAHIRRPAPPAARAPQGPTLRAAVVNCSQPLAWWLLAVWARTVSDAFSSSTPWCVHCSGQAATDEPGRGGPPQPHARGQAVATGGGGPAPRPPSHLHQAAVGGSAAAHVAQQLLVNVLEGGGGLHTCSQQRPQRGEEGVNVGPGAWLGQGSSGAVWLDGHGPFTFRHAEGQPLCLPVVVIRVLSNDDHPHLVQGAAVQRPAGRRGRRRGRRTPAAAARQLPRRDAQTPPGNTRRRLQAAHAARAAPEDVCLRREHLVLPPLALQEALQLRHVGLAKLACQLARPGRLRQQAGQLWGLACRPGFCHHLLRCCLVPAAGAGGGGGGAWRQAARAGRAGRGGAGRGGAGRGGAGQGRAGQGAPDLSATPVSSARVSCAAGPDFPCAASIILLKASPAAAPGASAAGAGGASGCGVASGCRTLSPPPACSSHQAALRDR